MHSACISSQKCAAGRVRCPNAGTGTSMESRDCSSSDDSSMIRSKCTRCNTQREYPDATYHEMTSLSGQTGIDIGIYQDRGRHRLLQAGDLEGRDSEYFQVSTGQPESQVIFPRKHTFPALHGFMSSATACMTLADSARAYTIWRRLDHDQLMS